MTKKKTDCFIADLTHTKQGVQAKCFPLGAGLVAEYAKQELGDSFEIEIFKYPDDLEENCIKYKPKILALSSYAWNHELSHSFAKAYKEFNKDAIIIFGGPNFHYNDEEREQFLSQYDQIDFFVFGEGEIAFSNLLEIILEHDFDIEKIKQKNERIDNCAYLYEDSLYCGDYIRIKNLRDMPSPYLNGTFDKFFQNDLIPLYETTRGCPFSCTFCSDGAKVKSKTYRHTQDTIDETLEYIAKKRELTDSLIVSDLNFGMYNDDIKTCETIAKLKEKYNFPVFFSASAGKSKFENILKSVKILDGSWFVGASVQSTDEKVLKNIKRKNLPYDKMIELANSTKDKGSVSYTEIILALPEDSKKKHFQSLKVSIDAGLNSIKMFQLMLLTGTEMSSQESIEQYGMSVKYRVMPSAAGQYTFFGKQYNVAEFEQIVVANNTLSFEDYLECRLMNLIVEIFINNATFYELFSVLDEFDISKFDTLEYIKENSNLYTKKIEDIFNSFTKDTQKDLYDNYDEIVSFIQTDGVIEKHITGELGNNEILDHKALSFIEYQDFLDLLYFAIVDMLKKKNVYTEEINELLLELKDFIVTKNSNLSDTSKVETKRYLYDFSKIRQSNFNDILKTKNSGRSYTFYHTEEQKNIINNLYTIYNGDTVAGLGRLIQKSNLNVLYRKFDIA